MDTTSDLLFRHAECPKWPFQRTLGSRDSLLPNGSQASLEKAYSNRMIQMKVERMVREIEGRRIPTRERYYNSNALPNFQGG